MTQNTSRTNKTILVNGLKKMGLALACMFLGPTFLHLALTNREKPLYIPLLIVGFIICGLALFFAFKGLKTILDSMFKKQ